MSMTLKKAITLAMDGKAVLFLGSGFSFGAKNCQNRTPWTGKALADHIADLCGFPGEPMPLEMAAQEYIRQKGDDALIELLHEEYDLSSVSSSHCTIMSLPYIRVYTTNYDRCAEIAYQNAFPDKPAMVTATLSDTPVHSINSPTCVHLNGSINRLSEDTLCNEFRLTEQSYVSDTLENKPWFRQFIQDIRLAKVVIFIGYSMTFDLDIKRHLSSPEMRKKLFFVVKPRELPSSVNFIETYGECSKLGTDGFAAEIEAEKSLYIPSINTEYTSFEKHTSPYPIGSVSYSDLINLYCLGQVKDTLFEKSPTNESRYLVDRTLLEDIVGSIRNGLSCPILITAALGCGKTVFVMQLIQRLLSESVNIFTFSQYNDHTLDELKSIYAPSEKKTVLILESYSQCWQILEQLSNHVNPNFALILTERSAIHRVTCGKLNRIFPKYKRKFLTELNSMEIRQLSTQLVNNNFDYIENVPSKNQRLRILEEKIKNEWNCHFSDILLQLFQSTDIHTRLVREFQQISSNSPVGKLVALALFSSVSNLRLNLTDFLELLHLDYVKLRLDENHTFQEFFSTEDSQIRVQSSVVARELLFNIQDISILTNALTTVVQTIGDSYSTNTFYKEILKSILSHSNFVHFVKKDETSAMVILDFYNSVRNTPFCQNDPLFWEQFASACIDANRFPEAESCLKTAFSKASIIPGYVPYQVETVQARYILNAFIYNFSTHTTSAEDVIKCLNSSYEHLFKYYDHPDNILAYVFNVSKSYAEVWKLSKSLLDGNQIFQFQSTIREILNRLKSYCITTGNTLENSPVYIALNSCLI